MKTKARYTSDNDPFIGIKNVMSLFKIKKGNGFDVPYFSFFFNDNGRHYKINQKGTPMPKLYTKLKASPNIVEKANAIKTPVQAAIFVIEQLGIACSELSKEQDYAFKVIISHEVDKRDTSKSCGNDTYKTTI